MTIKTKFNEGDRVFTIDTNTMKIKEFQISRITTWTSSGKTNVTLYDGDSYNSNGYDENKCFSTESELLTYITTKDDAKAL